MSGKKNELVKDWGVNDVDYNVYRSEVVNGKQKIVWVCSYYRKWASILERCFSFKFQEKKPTYKGCTVCEDWKYLSNFIKWVDSQPNKDWMDCDTDKDFLSVGNKHYSPETVVFVSSKVNQFIKDSGNDRGSCMIGVCYCPRSKKNPHQAKCCNPFTGKQEYLGMFPTELEAHKAWQAKKHEHSCNLAKLQKDPRIIKVLLEKYAPNKDWTKD